MKTNTAPAERPAEADLPYFLARLYGFELQNDRTFRRTTRDGTLQAVIRRNGPYAIDARVWKFGTADAVTGERLSDDRDEVNMERALRRAIDWLVIYNAEHPAAKGPAR